MRHFPPLLAALGLAVVLAACSDDEQAPAQALPFVEAGPGPVVPSPDVDAGDASPSTDPRVATAKDAFWSAFTSQQYDRIPAITQGLQAVASAHADDAELELLLGLTGLWGRAEIERDPAPSNEKAQAFGMAVVTHLTRAKQLSPGDLRINGWLGAALMSAGQPALAAQGKTMFDEGVAGFPEFNLFVRGIIATAMPRTSPAFADAEVAFFANLEACVSAKIDPDNLDYSKYMALETTSGPKRACWNGPKAAHNYEGFFLMMGDALAKGGKAQRARRAYESAKLSKTFASWPYASVLAERLTNVEARVALYTDADPKNDPEPTSSSGRQCSTCHAER